MSTPPSKKIKRENSTDSLFGMHGSSYKSDSSDSELLEPIKLPPFTQTVKIALRDDDYNECVWKMVRAWIMYKYSGHRVKRMAFLPQNSICMRHSFHTDKNDLKVNFLPNVNILLKQIFSS